jgi:hypothetical protein
MPDYVKTGPFVNSSAPGISAAFLNAVENVFRQSSGGTETGYYFLSGSPYTTGAVVVQWYVTISRNTTPVSMSIDTSLLAPTSGMGTPIAAQFYNSGFQIYCLTTTGPNTNARCGGLYTVQY